MELENYLIEQKPQILAISRISQILQESIEENYYSILRGKIDKSYLDNLKALICAIQMSAYAMRSYRKESYQQINGSYTDNFTFSSVIFEDLS